MTKQAELRAEAAGKRRMANLARRAGPGLSLADDRRAMHEHAQMLEAEAAGLEAQADAIGAQRQACSIVNS
jgi:hypothetical protein